MTSEPKPKGLKEIYQFPLRLKSDLSEFIIDNDLYVKILDNESKERLFGISDVEYGDNGLLCRYTSIRSSHNYEEGPLFMALHHLRSSNYVLITSVSERANEFNLALKLIGASSTSLFTGYGTSVPSRSFTPQCFFDFKLPALTVTQEEVNSLKNLVFQIHHNHDDKKFQIMSDIYMHAMSDKIRPESRFIELSIILEMLLLKNKAAEVSYRFSLRLAKFMWKYFDYSVKEVFENSKDIYTTRSNIAHAGEDKKLETNTPIAHEYVRKLLSKYLEDKTLFCDEKLNELCLG